MPNPRTPSPDDGGLRAVLERELEHRRGRAPEAGEIFVLPETAELPVEWALLEARPKAFLAIPADTQPLAGSRDFALGPQVLSGPLSLRCGHAVEIAAARLRPELRTGLLDPHSLAAVRSLQTALARGTAADDPMGEEVDRDPEYRDWVDEVLDPARAVMVGLGEGGGRAQGSDGATVVQLGDWRERGRKDLRQGGPEVGGWVRRASPWLAAALLAVSLGLGWRLVTDGSKIVFNPQYADIALGSDLRGDQLIKLEPGNGELLLSVSLGVPSAKNVRLRLLRKDGSLVYEGTLGEAGPAVAVPLVIPRALIRTGGYRLELESESGKILATEVFRIEVP